MLDQFDHWWVVAYRKHKMEFWTAGCGNVGDYFRCLIQDETVDKEMMKNVLAVIASHAKLAYGYADDFIQAPWPPGEAAIATDATASYLYAKSVKHGRFKDGEKAIATDGYLALEYATDILEGRFKEGEKAIAKSPRNAYDYMTAVMRGSRCKAMETAILPDFRCTYDYLVYLTNIGRRWPMGLNRLAEDARSAFDVAKDLIQGRWPAGEAAIATDAQYACRYAIEILEDEFPAGEAAIATDATYVSRYMQNVKDYWREGLIVLGIDPDDEF